MGCLENHRRQQPAETIWCADIAPSEKGVVQCQTVLRVCLGLSHPIYGSPWLACFVVLLLRIHPLTHPPPTHPSIHSVIHSLQQVLLMEPMFSVDSIFSPL